MSRAGARPAGRTRIAAGLFALAAGLALGAGIPEPCGAEGPELERILFGSCVLQSRSQPIFDTAVSLEPDLFVFLGDNIYADTRDPAVMRRKYDTLAASPSFQRLRRSCPVEATWDDHDYGENDAGADYPMKEVSRQIFLEFWNEPEDSPRRRRGGIYAARRYGPPERRVQLILLDTRSFRSPLRRGNPNPTDDLGPYVPHPAQAYDAAPESAPTLLGDAQWRWLEERLREPAQLRLIASSIQVINDESGWECWGNFPAERRRLFQLLEATGASGVAFISGDRHFAELSMEQPPGLYPLYDLTSSALNISHPSGRTGTNSHRVAGPYTRPNLGVVEIRWGPPVRLRLQIRDQEGALRFEHRLELEGLGLPGAGSTAPRPSP